MDYAAALCLVIGFVCLVHYLGLIKRSKEAIRVAGQVVAVLRNSTLSDDEKETAMRAHAIMLFRLFLQTTVGAALSVFLPGAVLWFLSEAGWVSFESVLNVTLSWEFISGSTIGAVVVICIYSKAGHGLPE